MAGGLSARTAPGALSGAGREYATSGGCSQRRGWAWAGQQVVFLMETNCLPAVSIHTGRGVGSLSGLSLTATLKQAGSAGGRRSVDDAAPRSSGAELIRRLQRRYPGAFEELLDSYEQPVYHFIYRLLDDPSDAPDVTQDVFVKIFLKVGDFRGDSSLKTWIYRIAVHEASNRRRWFSRHRGRELSLDFSPHGDGLKGHWFVDPQETPFDALSRQEQMQLVENALRAIDSRLRCAVVMRDIEGMSYQEIADTLKVSLGTVKSRILRGRETLKKRLRREVGDPVPEACALQPE